MKKKIISVMLSICFVMTACSCVMAKQDKITVEINGKTIEFDVEPEIIDDRVMLPMRKIFEEIGAVVKWDDTTRTVTARKSSKTVSITIDSDELFIDKGKTDDEGNAITDTITLDVPAQISEERTLVPARAVSEAFGFEVDWDDKTKTVSITSNSDSDDLWKENKVSINLDDLSIGDTGYDVSEKTVTITEGGDYTLSGTLNSGMICVNTENRVKLRLSGVTITSDDTPCIYIENADKAYITISDGTKNYLTTKNTESGAVYSKDNLEIKGKGELYITSEQSHGIKASDNLTIESGIINITAKKDAIKVNDTLSVTGGNIKTSSEGDGIVSESILSISGGMIDVTTMGEPTVNQAEENSEHGRFMPLGENKSNVTFESSSKGIKADWILLISGGDISVNSADHAIHCVDEIRIDGGNMKIASEYGKGITAHANMTIDGADTSIDISKSTEGIESKDVLTINNGTIKIIASDDGINATGGNSGNNFGGGGGDMTQPEFDGDRNERKHGFDENFQPPKFDVENDFRNSDSAIMMMPPDAPQMDREHKKDGFEGPNKEMGMRSFKDCLIINGGDIEVYAEDDCLDANGNLQFNGGTIKASVANGSFSGNFAVFDPDGTLTVAEGVTLIATATQGSERDIDIPQNSITVYCENSHSDTDTVTVKTSAGKTIAEYTPYGSYNSILISSPDMESGKEYVVSAGDEKFEITAKDGAVTAGTPKNNGFNNRNGRKN